jgi:hypothetical protein
LLAASTAVPAAALLASSTGLVVFIAPVVSDFIESIFIESDFIESVDDVVVDGVVAVVAGVVVVVDDGAGAGVGVVAGAGAGAGAGVAAGGGAGSFLPQAASATTIIEASNSDLFILYKPFMVIRNGVSWLILVKHSRV